MCTRQLRRAENAYVEGVVLSPLDKFSFGYCNILAPVWDKVKALELAPFRGKREVCTQMRLPVP